MPLPVERPDNLEKSNVHHGKPMVLIQWIDAESSSRWYHEVDLNENYQMPIIETVGFIMRENDEYVSVAGSVQSYEDVSNQFCNLMTIPRGCIKSITRLRRGKPHVIPTSR